ncbi:hypothetical protein BgAZ_209050 [Babesia gibsoni]|uniref:C3H1-type domain-containing protein n=1 Tax=Babesia gibsoni TaxID=33632 RepID=A0AAD8UUZ0_BABGI|nr:hypothetical protein BgAZ_209050 [Babesia gibsoni]
MEKVKKGEAEIMQPENKQNNHMHMILKGKELKEFRTKQCPLYVKGMCPDSKQCNMSHSETWPRRNPSLFKYDYQLCPNIQFSRSDNKMRLLGKCSYGRKCRFSHSKEEQLYHPDLYKTRMCLNHPFCTAYYCPFAHSEDELRIKKKSKTHVPGKGYISLKEGDTEDIRDAGNATPEISSEESNSEEEEYRRVSADSQKLTEAIASMRVEDYKYVNRGVVEPNSRNSTVSSPTMMATQEVLGIADIGLTTLGETVILQDDADDYMEYFNRYVGHISGSTSASAELAIALASSTDYTRMLFLSDEHERIYSLDEEDENEWFDGVIRAGLQLLGEEATEPLGRENPGT